MSDQTTMSVEHQVDLLMRGTYFADEVEGKPAQGTTSLRLQMRAELTAKLKKGRPLRVYLGVDPTATSLHIGHMVPVLKLRQFQDLGHQAVFLIGDYTGLIGDPSGQTKERPQLTGEQLQEMSQGYTDQVFRVLDGDRTEVRRNSEWLAKMGFADIIRLAAVFPLKQIIARREFQERMEAGPRPGVRRAGGRLRPALQSPGRSSHSAAQRRRAPRDGHRPPPGGY